MATFRLDRVAKDEHTDGTDILRVDRRHELEIITENSDRDRRFHRTTSCVQRRRRRRRHKYRLVAETGSSWVSSRTQGDASLSMILWTHTADKGLLIHCHYISPDAQFEEVASLTALPLETNQQTTLTGQLVKKKNIWLQPAPTCLRNSNTREANLKTHWLQ